MKTDLSVETLIEMLQDHDPLVRVQAGFVLGTMGEAAEPAISLLMEMLTHGEAQDRKLAATTLGLIGPAAVEAVPSLLKLIAEDDEASELAEEALERIDLAEEDEGLAEAA